MASWHEERSHGSRGRGGAPVTLADVKAIARETWKAAGTGKDSPSEAGADILGWDFAFELNETAKQVAAESYVNVAFKKIPREVLDKKAVEQGDVKFIELEALAMEIKQKANADSSAASRPQNDNGRAVTVKLTDFAIPTDDIPEEARKAIKHWNQLVDYWAVDWDYKNDTFHNERQSYRTRKDSKIELEAKRTYPGSREIQCGGEGDRYPRAGPHLIASLRTTAAKGTNSQLAQGLL